MCLCTPGLPAVLKVVHEEGSNLGRRYWICAKPVGDNCSFFEWADAEAGGNADASLVGSDDGPLRSYVPVEANAIPEVPPSPLAIWVDLFDVESLPGGAIPEVDPNPPGGMSVALQDAPRPRKSWSGLMAKAKKGIADLTDRVLHD